MDVCNWLDGISWCLMTLTFLNGVSPNGNVIVQREGFRDYCDTEKFHASCEESEVVYVESANYGRMGRGRCIVIVYGAIGCGADVLHIADWMCSGRPHCQIPVPNSEFKKATDCPHDLKPYFRVDYKCLKVEMAADQQCKASSFVVPSGSYGYLSSYVTKETRKGSEQCPWLIQAHEGQRINFTIYDFARRELQNTAPQTLGGVSICRVYATVREGDKDRSSTVCSGNGRIAHAYLSTSHRVEVRILGKMEDDNPEYFLLKYEILGCPKPEVPESAMMEREGDVAVITCLATNTKWRIICEGNTWSGSYGNCTRAKMGEIRWGDMLMSFEMSLTIVVGIAIGIGILILSCGVICFCSVCRPKKKPRPPDARKRPVNPVPPQRSVTKRHNGTLPPRSPGVILRNTGTSHGPLPPPPAFLMDKDETQPIENEYSYISDLPPPPPTPTPPPPYPDPVAGVVIANPMTSYSSNMGVSDSEPDYTSPPTPYTSPRHTHYDVTSLQSGSTQDVTQYDDSAELGGGLHIKNRHYSAGDDPDLPARFSMRIYSPEKKPSARPQYFDWPQEASVPYDACQTNGQVMPAQAAKEYNFESLQSRYWRNKQPLYYVAQNPAHQAALYSTKTGTM